MAISKTKEYRKELAEMFTGILEEKELDWKKEWKGLSNMPVNAKREYRYKGMNAFYLMLTALERGYADPRWATFNQIKEMGCRLHDAKGMGVQVEYWFPYDTEERHVISWQDFRTLTGGKPDDRYILRAKYSTVFNAAHIEGLPERELSEKNDVEMDALVKTLSVNMGVEIINDGGDRAFYRNKEDKIHLPVPEAFTSDYAYNSTAMHELAHSTGAAHRLNRKLRNAFGSEEYAFEELIAEITSCFMSVNLNMEQDSLHIENHKAYVQSWISAIREKPETLVKAIAEAEKAAAYMEYKAELIPAFEYEKIADSSMEVPDTDIAPQEKSLIDNAAEQLQLDEHDKYKTTVGEIKDRQEKLLEEIKEINAVLTEVVPKFGTYQMKKEALPKPLDLEDYLAQKGVGSPIGPYQDDKLIGHMKVLGQESTKKDYEKTSEEYWQRRQSAKEEYHQLVEAGQVRPLTTIERTIRTANGHPDNPSVQASRRMAEKRGYDWKTGERIKMPEEVQKGPKL